MALIRAATSDDAVEIARLIALMYGSREAPERYAERLIDPHRVDTPVLALVDDQAAGIANLRILQPVFHSRPYAELTELYVVEGFRRRGIGRELVLFTEQMARESGAGQMLILTDFYNHQAQQLYRSLGYAHYDIVLNKSLE